MFSFSRSSSSKTPTPPKPSTPKTSPPTTPPNKESPKQLTPTKSSPSILFPFKRRSPTSSGSVSTTASLKQTGSNRKSTGEPPSPPDSVESQLPPENRGIGRVAARIKNTLLGKGDAEGSGSGSPSSVEGRKSREVLEQGGGKSGDGDEDGSGSGKGKENENDTGNDTGKGNDDGEQKKKSTEMKRGWSGKRKARKMDKWRAKKSVDEDVMPPGMLEPKAEPDQRWGRRMIWSRGRSKQGDEGGEDEGEKKKRRGGTTMLDASPAPVRLPSTEMIEKVKKRKKDEPAEVEVEEADKEEEEEEEEEAEDEWDEESLIRLSDWWRQLLGRGRDPTVKELDMIGEFLGDLLEEETPTLDMILNTRLHKLLETLMEAASEQGMKYEGDRFRKIAMTAEELKSKWMNDMGGRLYSARTERRKLLCGEKGRLERVHVRPVGEHGLRWVVEGECEEESVEYEPGMWWLNDACARRDGILLSTCSAVSVNPLTNPVLVLEYGEEMPTHNPTITRYTHVGQIGSMLVPLLRALDRRVQVLRKYTLKSRLAPVAGLRYDGFFNIVVYSLKQIGWDGASAFRVVIELERCMGQRSMEKVVAVPTPSMLDDWDIYLEIKNESVRKSVGEEWWRRSQSKEREEEDERIVWHRRRELEDARRVEEDKRREKEKARRVDEDARRMAEDEKMAEQMKKAQQELDRLEAQEKEEEERKRAGEKLGK